MKWLRVLAEVCLAVMVGFMVWIGSELGLLMNLIAFGLMVAAPVILLSRVWHATKGEGLYPCWQSTPDHAVPFRMAVFAVRSLCWFVCVLACYVAILPTQIGDAYAMTILTFVVTGLGLVLLDAFPPPTVRYVGLVTRLLITVVICIKLVGVVAPTHDGPIFELDFPMKGDWVVFQGGGSTLINHHAALRQQRHALDLLRVENGGVQDANTNGVASVYAFDKPVFAPVDGKVVQVVDAMLDHESMNIEHDNPAGNHVVIQADAERFITLAHLKRGSIPINIGDSVRAGTLIGRVGNSGNTTMAHMHLQVHSEADFMSPTSYTFPMRFRNARVLRAGNPIDAGVEARRNDRIIVDDEAQ